MPDHLIFDYFTSTTSDEDASVPEELRLQQLPI